MRPGWIASISIAWLVAGPSPATGAEPLAAGAKLFTLHCAVCHGDQGNGVSMAARALNPPPRNFRDPKMVEVLTRERMSTSIHEGRPGTGMASWKGTLSDQEIDALIDYIRGTFMQLDSGARDPAVSARVEQGRAIYNERCFVCHGYRGNADTEAARVLRPPPRDFTDAAQMNGIDPDRIFQSIKLGRAGTGMMPFGSVLSDAEIGALTDFISRELMAKKVETQFHSAENGWPHFAAENASAIRYYYDDEAAAGSANDRALGRYVFERACVSCHIARKNSGDHSSPFMKRMAPPVPPYQVE